MPQLTKGGKWVFGWAVVGQQNDILIPPAAYSEYCFQAEEGVVFTRGSRRSGGFGLGKPENVLVSVIRTRIIAQGRMGPQGRVTLFSGVDAKPGERFLVVRGSNRVLSFLQQGPIVEEALRHPDIEVFAP